MAYVVPPMDTPSVPVAGSDDRFPVRRIFCVGRNYADHAREVGSELPAEPMMFFIPNTSVCGPGDPVVIPNSEGGRTTPSVVAFAKEGERLVGQAAMEVGG